MLHIKLHFPYFSFEMAPFQGTFFSFRRPKRSLWQTYLPFHWDVMMWCRPNDKWPTLTNIKNQFAGVSLATLWFWGFWGSLTPHLVGKIHHPWLLYLLWVHILIHEQTYKKTTSMLKFNNSSTKFLKYLAKRWWFLGCFFHAPGMNCSTGWQLEPRAPLNWIRDVARDVRH